MVCGRGGRRYGTALAPVDRTKSVRWLVVGKSPVTVPPARSPPFSAFGDTVYPRPKTLTARTGLDDINQHSHVLFPLPTVSSPLHFSHEGRSRFGLSRLLWRWETADLTMGLHGLPGQKGTCVHHLGSSDGLR